MKSESLIALLEAQIARLKKLKGEEVGGFFLIQAPGEDQAVVALFMESEPTRESFYKYLQSKIVDALKAEEKQNQPLIGIRGGIR